jgi:hypothetical protein
MARQWLLVAGMSYRWLERQLADHDRRCRDRLWGYAKVEYGGQGRTKMAGDRILLEEEPTPETLSMSARRRRRSTPSRGQQRRDV